MSPQLQAVAPRSSTPAKAARTAVRQRAPIPAGEGSTTERIERLSGHLPELAGGMRLSAASEPFEQQAERLASSALLRPGAYCRRPNRGVVSATPTGESGTPLSASDRGFFEPRFGHDFSRVRVHRDSAAAASARALAAKAFTHGEHLFFAAGHYAPQTGAGRRLLAHELAHVVQQRRGDLPRGVIWRAEDDASESGPTEYVRFAVEITTDPEHAAHNHFMTADEDSGDIDLGTAYPGDVLHIRRVNENQDNLTDAVTLTLVPGLELVEQTAEGAVLVRVAASAVAGKPLSLEIVDGAKRKHKLVVAIGRLPKSPKAVNPEFARVRGERKSLRAKRRDTRKAARKVRRAARSERRDERRRLRATQRSERRALRKQATALRREARALRQAESCGEGTQKDIQAALLRAIAAADKSLGRLRGADALGDAEITAALSLYMRWTPSEPKSPASARHLNRILDTLTVARNSMTLATHGDFECTLDCRKQTGALIHEGSRRRSSVDTGVSVCPAWITGRSLKFAVTTGMEEARAYALLHEFVHKSGPMAEEKDQFYVGRPAWGGLNAVEALGYADGYASLAWVLANKSGGAP